MKKKEDRKDRTKRLPIVRAAKMMVRRIAGGTVWGQD